MFGSFTEPFICPYI